MTPYHPLTRQQFPGGGELDFLEVVRREDGGPIRLITHGRQHKVVGSFYSVKKGTSVPWESRTELHDLYRAEVSADVRAYYAQPETIHFGTKGKSYRYTPDRLDILADGTRRYVEVKGHLKDEHRPGYGEKIDLVRSIYKGLGHVFEIVERSQIEAEPAFSAIKEVQAFRRTAVTTHHVLEVRRRLGDQAVAWADAAAHIGEHGHQILCAMVVRRIVTAELEGGLTPRTMVRLVRERGGRHD